MIRQRHLNSVSFPTRHRREENQDDSIFNLFFKQEIELDIKDCDYVQGQQTCPICEGVVNYTWSQFEGFLRYECSTNDCLPWPEGGARQRREVGLPKVIPTRYAK